MLNSVGAIYDYNRARSNEHAANKFSTVLGLGALAATPYLVKKLDKVDPIKTAKVEYNVARGIEKVSEYIKNAADSTIGKKVISYANDFIQKAKESKIVKTISSNKTVQNIAEKVTEALKKFSGSTKIVKGKYALIAAGMGLLTYTGYKIVTNYFKKEGAIDQKYNDMRVMDKILV